MTDVYDDPRRELRRKDSEEYRRTYSEGSARKDPRLASRREEDRSNSERKPKHMYDKLGVPISPIRNKFSRSPSPRRGERSRFKVSDSSSPQLKHDWNSPHVTKQASQMYSQPPPNHNYQPTQGTQLYNEAYAAYPGYQQSYPQGYPAGYAQYGQPGYNPQNYTGHAQGTTMSNDYPGDWAPVPYNVAQQGSSSLRPGQHAPTSAVETKVDESKKEAIAQERKHQRATLYKQRDEYLKKAAVLRPELEKLRAQTHTLLTEKSPSREVERVLRKKGKLQLVIQEKLKSIMNVVDMLTGIIGDDFKAGEEDEKVHTENISPKHKAQQDADAVKANVEVEVPRYNYVHYDPEMHWCRTCDVFPSTAKDYLNHLHSAEHKQVTQERQLVDNPWHKQAAEQEIPTYKGAPNKRVPIKGLQFFIPATAWYCKLCDSWVGDLYCASIHVRSKNHTQNYTNFVEQNPHWENSWKKDREAALVRCAKAKGLKANDALPQPPEPPLMNDKKGKKRKETLVDLAKDKKKKRKSKKRKKTESSGSSSSSSSSDSSSDEDSDRSKSVRVAMRNKMIQAQARHILNEEIGDKWEILGRLMGDERGRVKGVPPPPPPPEKKPPEPPQEEDNSINQWMTISAPNNDKLLLGNLKGRLKQRHDPEKEKAMAAISEQRKRDREREERELKEMREREQREIEQRLKEEREKEQRDLEEREKAKERERNRRKKPPSPYGSPDRFTSSSRGHSSERKFIPPNRTQKTSESKLSPPEVKFKNRQDFIDEANKDDDKSKDKKGSRKLPFIGRMPLYKKKGDDDKDVAKEEYEFRPSKFEQGSSAKAFIPAPGVVHITKLATPQDPMYISADNPPPPPKIIPEPPMISGMTAPPPPRIKDVITTLDERDVQDMELEDNVGPLPPGVSMSEGKPLVKPAGNHLPRDFQDALNIIFPGDQRALLAMQSDPNAMLQYQQYYGMMYPNMQLYDYSRAHDAHMANPPDDDDELMPEPQPPPPDTDDKEDLAMLGIDAEDMAAQTI